MKKIVTLLVLFFTVFSFFISFSNINNQKEKCYEKEEPIVLFDITYELVIDNTTSIENVIEKQNQYEIAIQERQEKMSSSVAKPIIKQIKEAIIRFCSDVKTKILTIILSLLEISQKELIKSVFLSFAPMEKQNAMIQAGIPLQVRQVSNQEIPCLSYLPLKQVEDCKSQVS